MQVFEEFSAERRALPTMIGAAASADPASDPFAGRAVGYVRRLVARLAERRRRRPRPRIGSWMAMDPRVLADIGIARADIQAVAYGDVPFEQLARGPVETPAGGLLVTPRPWRPKLCLVATTELDAAA